MARKVKSRESNYVFSAYGDSFGGGIADVHLVRGGKQAYLWIGRRDVQSEVVILSGQKFLRDLAHAILKEVPRG